MLPIAVDAVNDSPKVIVPHHRLVKLSVFDIRRQHPTTQPWPTSTDGNLTVSISTDTTSGHMMLRGMSVHNSTIEVKTFREQSGAEELAISTIAHVGRFWSCQAWHG